MNLELLAALGPTKGVEVAKEKIAFRDWALTDAAGDLERFCFDGLDRATHIGGEHGRIMPQLYVSNGFATV